jgi:hypothetical protein
MRRGEAFDTDSGLPDSQFHERQSVTWYQHALDYIAMKWPEAAGKSRISIVETLTAITPVLVRSEAGSPDPVVLRSALRRWAFVPDRSGDNMPPEVRAALAWLRRRSLPITSLQDDKILRRVLNTLARRLDGAPGRARLSGPPSPRVLQRGQVRGSREAASGKPARHNRLGST